MTFTKDEREAAWYGPEHYREPPSAVASAIQWPLHPAEVWQSRIINAFAKDARDERRSRRALADEVRT